jgi:hypothetical protein
MTVKKARKSKSKAIAIIEPAATTTNPPIVATVVEQPVEGRYFDGGVILKDGRWTRSLKSCKGVAEYVTKAGKRMVAAVKDYRRCKDGTILYWLVFIDRQNPERVCGFPQKDKDGNLTVGFPAKMQGTQKPGSGFVTSVKWFAVD